MLLRSGSLSHRVSPLFRRGRTEVSPRLYQKNFPPFLRSKNSKNGGLKVCLGVRQQDYFFLLVFPLAVLVVGSTVLPVCFLAPCPILEVDLAITRSPVIRRLRNRYELRYSYRRVNYQSLQNLKYQSSQFLNICEEYFQIVFSRRSLEASQQRRSVAVGDCESYAPLLCSRFHSWKNRRLVLAWEHRKSARVFE